MRKILNLSENFTPVRANYSFETVGYTDFTFSGGEPHIKIQYDVRDDDITITTRISSFNDIGLLLLAADALKRSGAKSLSLVIPYFPGARQDRVMVKGEPLTVKVYADIINSIGFKGVVILDPHSDVTTALINNCKAVYSMKFYDYTIKSKLEKGESFSLIVPDAGMAKKIKPITSYLANSGYKFDVIQCGKARDVRDGKITSFEVYADEIVNTKCFVIDDICDGGGTFIGLGRELIKKGAESLHLIVTHGIFSKGLDALLDVYSSFTCTDSIPHSDYILKNIREEKINLKDYYEI